MNIYKKKSVWKWLLILAAGIIVGLSLLYFNHLTDEIAEEESKKANLIAITFKRINSVTDDEYRGFLLEIVKNNTSIPVMLVDENGNITAHRNVINDLDRQRKLNDKIYSKEIDDQLSIRLEEMKHIHEPIEIKIFEGYTNYVYYDNSLLWRQLKYFPYAQIIIILLFLGIAYFLFSTSRKAEQNQVWVGMSKETAHQLGTPISSMIGWVEYIKSMNAEDLDLNVVVPEMDKDVKRLEQIAERFSKIGSEPDLDKSELSDAVKHTYDYMKKRASEHINFEFDSSQSMDVMLSAPLFSWVIENLIKNALNAIVNDGEISITVFKQGTEAIIDVKDSGKGIAKGNFALVFKPGYTTRKRGWGLGLSLTKRIVEEYHQGKIFVKESAINQGTTFRIILPISK
jgi:signal transduction histidine kinase